jgi:tetratricopeptide (TPR) repeat protein
MRRWQKDIAMIKRLAMVAMMLAAVHPAVAAAAAKPETVDSLRAALAGKQEPSVKWAATESKLGQALTERGTANLSSDDISEAIDAFGAALTVQTKAALPLGRAATLRDRAAAERQLGDMLDDTQWYDNAIADEQEALTGFTRDESPLDWAATEEALGGVAMARAASTGAADDWRLARDAYTAALEIYDAVNPDGRSRVEAQLAEIARQLGE